MKRKIIITAMTAVLLIAGLGISGYANEPSISKFKNLQKESSEVHEEGEYLVSTVGNLSDMEQNVTAEDVVTVGKDILVTEPEIETAKDYYLAQNENESKAENDALDYMTEFDAMYVEAVKNGYDVSESEVKAYVNNLKKIYAEAENKDDIKEIISTYDSEDAYWEDMIRVYYKQLPIEKYVSSLEEDFQKHCKYAVGTSEYDSAWEANFQKIKDDAVKNQRFKNPTEQNLNHFIDD